VPIRGKYENIHLLPMFKKKIAFGNSGLPWKLNSNNLKIIYKKGICPNAENINKEEYLGIPLCDYDFNNKNILVIVGAFKKIWKNFVKFK
jgi:hypothetical protein